MREILQKLQEIAEQTTQEIHQLNKNNPDEYPRAFVRECYLQGFRAGIDKAIELLKKNGS